MDVVKGDYSINNAKIWDGLQSHGDGIATSVVFS
jgi:hypothetical protein